jgi:hypothetical protein
LERKRCAGLHIEYAAARDVLRRLNMKNNAQYCAQFEAGGAYNFAQSFFA